MPSLPSSASPPSAQMADLAFDVVKTMSSKAVRPGSIPAYVKLTDHCVRPERFRVKALELASALALLNNSLEFCCNKDWNDDSRLSFFSVKKFLISHDIFLPGQSLITTRS